MCLLVNLNKHTSLVYTDSSAENVIRNGGAGAYIQYLGGKEDKISLPTRI